MPREKLSPIHPSINPPIHFHRSTGISTQPSIDPSHRFDFAFVCDRLTQPCVCILCCRQRQPTVAYVRFRRISTDSDSMFLFATGWSSHSACSKDSHRDNSCVCFVSFSYLGVFDSGHYPSGISHRLQQPGMNRLRDN